MARAPAPARLHTGLGSLHVLSDALLLEVLGWLEPRDLARFSTCSGACYAFSDTEDLWKGIVLEVRVQCRPPLGCRGALCGAVRDGATPCPTRTGV